MRRPQQLLLTLLMGATLTTAAWYERDAHDGIVKELGPKLSTGAAITLQSDEGFTGKNKRWQTWASPDVSAVVDVQTEEDVQETIRYANQHNIPFLAKSGGHGAVSSMKAVKNGILINMRALNTMQISQDGTYATLGGGVTVKEVQDHLWAHSKQTVTGCCECVGLTAVVLGGGHGLLQGYHGLLSDQLLSLRLILANASIVTVSETEHPDLFWALQGAGHNFGIVTSLDYKTYSVVSHPGKGVWSYEAFTYPATPENVRKVYSIAQSQLHTQPEGALQYGLVLINPAVSREPIILHHVVQNGLLSDLKAFTQPYHDIDPLAVASEEGIYTDVPRYLQTEKDGLVCNAQDFMPGAGIVRFPVDVKDYNIDALVAAVARFVEVTTSAPEFAGSFMMIEQYSSHGVRAVNDEKSAFANREFGLLLAPALFYPSVNAESEERNVKLDELAEKYGEEIREILVEGAKNRGGSRAYVNYATGTESLDAIYGREKLERLKKLKREYDPDNKFGFYAPIIAKAREAEGHSEL